VLPSSSPDRISGEALESKPKHATLITELVTLRDHLAAARTAAGYVGAKNAPSRDHGQLIDGSLSLDSCRGGWVRGDSSLGPSTDSCAATKTSAWFLSPARKADVTSYPSCQRDVPDSRSLQRAVLVPSAGKHF
jgi:hypothetical protein